MVLPHRFLLLRIGIYKRSCTCYSTALVELVQEHFDSAQKAVRFEKAARNK